MMKTIGGGDPQDFDEVRRLLYMALLAKRTERYELAGTLVNALVHHHQVDDLHWSEAAENVIAAIEGETSGKAWVHEQIARITGELGDLPPVAATAYGAVEMPDAQQDQADDQQDDPDGEQDRELRDDQPDDDQDDSEQDHD